MAEAAMRVEGAVAVALARLRDMFLNGQLLPGEQVRQEQIAEQLGVGRAPLREALNVLAKQGPLVHRPNQGYFVAKRLLAQAASQGGFFQPRAPLVAQALPPGQLPPSALAAPLRPV